MPSRPRVLIPTCVHDFGFQSSRVPLWTVHALLEPFGPNSWMASLSPRLSLSTVHALLEPSSSSHSTLSEHLDYGSRLGHGLSSHVSHVMMILILACSSALKYVRNSIFHGRDFGIRA